MNAVLLIACREYRQIIATRGFWVTLLIVPLALVVAPPAGGDQALLPLLAPTLLFMSLMLSGSWMLQTMVEERSNKLLESLLACVSPGQLMAGKLVGTVAVGLTLAAGAIGAVLVTHGAVAGFAKSMLTQPGTALAMLYFFLAGYLMVALIFVTIGAVSQSFRDAQAYLSPVILTIALPFAMIVPVAPLVPPGIALRILSWIPLYTPFVLLARLGAGVPLWEGVGCGLVLAAFVALEASLLGRLFRRSLLT